MRKELSKRTKGLIEICGMRFRHITSNIRRDITLFCVPDWMIQGTHTHTHTHTHTKQPGAKRNQEQKENERKYTNRQCLSPGGEISDI